MSPEKQRIAIAEASGRRIELWTEPSGTSYWVVLGPDGNVVSDAAPDYLNDLNAMHEAEITLSDDQYHTFMEELRNASYKAIKDIRPLPKIFRAYSASAAQRAEAFLRTLNLWTEE